MLIIAETNIDCIVCAFIKAKAFSVILTHDVLIHKWTKAHVLSL